MVEFGCCIVSGGLWVLDCEWWIVDAGLSGGLWVLHCEWWIVGAGL